MLLNPLFLLKKRELKNIVNKDPREKETNKEGDKGLKSTNKWKK